MCKITYAEALKRAWISAIAELTSDDIYELFTAGGVRIEGGICSLCLQNFEPCDETLVDDELCRRRFSVLCEMEIE